MKRKTYDSKFMFGKEVLYLKYGKKYEKSRDGSV